MKAVKVLKKGQAHVVNDAPIPELPGPAWIRIKTVALALNPTDWKHVEHVDVPATVGCDISGVVDEVGSGVTKNFKKGDRVAAICHGSNTLRLDGGAFGEYAITKGDLIMHVPDDMSFEEAAPIGVAVITVGQGLYQEMQLPWPSEPLKEKKQILIYGGSSGMGSAGIQFAKLSGFEVLTTCSPKNFDYVKSLGAEHVFDAYDPDVGKKIREFTDNKLYYAWDCIGEHGAPQQCADALASSAPEGQEIRYGTILRPDFTREDVIVSVSIGYSCQGEAWEIAFQDQKLQMPAQPDHFEFMKKWTSFAEQLLKEGKWKPHRQEVREGGFEGILKGMDDMKNGKVSGAKVVYRVAEP